MKTAASPLGLIALVTHARDVASEERERFALAATSLAHDRRAILLRTCHRVELYLAHGPNEARVNGGGPPEFALPDLPMGGRALRDEDAARHVITVAAGLDSVVVGEDQILRQMRDCLAARHIAALEPSATRCVDGERGHLTPEHGSELAPVLDRLFQLAFHVGRQSRSWREGPPRSLADVAVERLATRGTIAGQSVLVVGAGQMSRLVAHAARRMGASVVITNRTGERAATLAAEVAGSTIPFGEAPSVRGIVVAISGGWNLRAPAARSLIESDATVIDLSSPPALAAEVRSWLGPRFVSVDDVARGFGGSMSSRLRLRIEKLIDEAVAELVHWAAARRGVPAIQALSERAESRRAAEVERLLRRLPDLRDHERDLVEQMSHRLVAGLLHTPLASLRDDESGERALAARDLFAL